MASVTSLASFLVVYSAIFTLKVGVEGCSCQLMHPQAQFCRSQFVVKALIERSRLVELRPNGKYKRVRSHDTEIIALPQVVEEDVNTIQHLPVDVGLSTVQNGSTESDRTMSEYNLEQGGDVEGINNVGPSVDNDEIDAHRRRRSMGGARHRRNYHVGAPPGFAHPPVTPTSRTMVQYRVRLVKVFKGLENVTKQQLKFVYAPPAPLCSVVLRTGGTPYILMGDLHNGVLMIRLCDYKLDMSGLTRSENKNLMHNMMERFPKSCDTCYVKVCDRNSCNEETKEPYSCEWKEWQTAQSAKACQYTCLQTKEGKCKWYNPLERKGRRRRS